MTQDELKLVLEALKEAQTNDDGMEKWDRNKKAIAVVEKALAQPEQALTGQDIAALVTGMEVSIDVSTGDHDSGHRLFGVVDLVQQSQGSKHGLILLVQETKANFKEALAQTQEPVATLFGSLPVYDTTPPQRIEQDGQCKRCTDGCPACDATKLQKESHDLL